LVGGYLAYLAGATVRRWRMPLWTHFPLILLFALAVVLPQWSPPSPEEAAVELRERLHQGLRSFSEALEKEPCSEMALQEMMDREPQRFLESGLRRHAVPTRWRVQGVPKGAPFASVNPERPGTVFLRCYSDQGFEMAVAALERVPWGRPSLLRDEAGLLVIATGRAR
jgi:hypothetical protein